jgi:hypothetical protein
MEQPTGMTSQDNELLDPLQYLSYFLILYRMVYVVLLF